MFNTNFNGTFSNEFSSFEQAHQALLAVTLSLTHSVITFANNLDPDQNKLNVGPCMDPNCLTLYLCS